MTAPFRLTPRAATDLNHIAAYSLGKRGRRQTTAYLEALNDRFVWLAEYPEIGRARPEVLPGLRSFREGSHIIFYRARETGIEIIGVPHMSMDILEVEDLRALSLEASAFTGARLAGLDRTYSR